MHSITEEHNPHRTVKVLAVAIIVLAFTAATAIGGFIVTSEESTTNADVETEESPDTDESSQTVAMKIEVDADDVLDLEMSHGDVVVDTWDGDDVLVIVEKLPGHRHTSRQKPRSLNIKVTRRGNNVRIATLDTAGQPFSDPSLSLRIMVPKQQFDESNVSSIYDLSKLTSVVFKALHREALKWVGL